MNRLRRQQINPQKNNAATRRDLFIYYLKGRLKAASGMFQNNFLGNWQEEDDSFLFFSSPASRQVQNILYQQRQLSYVDSYEMSYDQWLGEVFDTFDHGKFRITPIWESGKGQSGDEKVEILLDPGLVFGTGTHPTTRDCLEALEAAACSEEFKAEGFIEKKRFILSGLLRSEAKDVADRLSRHPVKILKQWTRDGIWHTFYGKTEQT